MTLTGRCHCGNLSVELETALSLHELPLRACQCSFCRAHGAVSISDPAGSLRVRVTDERELMCYRFGLGVTDFFICRRCGVYLLALAELEGGRYAVVNANTLGCREQLDGPIQPMDYDTDTRESRAARRRGRWTPVTALDMS